MIRNRIVRQLVILIAMLAVMAGTYFSREPLIGLGDAGFWMIFAMGMITGATLSNLITLLRNRKK